MIDIHSHMLPGIDDGAQTLNDGIDLARYAVARGITHSVITPHIHPGRYDNNIDTIDEAFQHLQNEIKKQNISLKIAYAAEVRISVEMMELITHNKIPFLGQYQNKNVLLLEFPHSHILPGSENLIKWLTKRNIKPIIVHPERNKELQADFSKITPFLKAGCLLQVTAGSLIGKFGPKSQQISQLLIKNNWAHFVATDAHNLKHRPPDLSDAYQYLKTEIGETQARKLLYDNPWSIVKNKFQ
ncbi:MAG: capsular biosynthesis protein [Gammaproteobacteria bacterium]|nr:capsular biosynthesis protein [Gammaproteobacteria bacterium]